MKRTKEVESGKERDDIQWLRAKYKLVLEREEKLLRYLDNKLGIIDHRLDSLEEKVGDG